MQEIVNLYRGAASGQAQQRKTANEIAPSAGITFEWPQRHLSTDLESSSAGGLEKSISSEAPTATMTSKLKSEASEAAVMEPRKVKRAVEG